MGAKRYCTKWAQEKPYLQNHLRFNPIPTGQVTLAIGQTWHSALQLEASDSPYVIEVVGLGPLDTIEYVKWWPSTAKMLRPKVGDRVFRRSPAILCAPFDSVFPTAATFRQLYLDMPHSHLQAGSNRVARLTIRIKKELRPSYPLPLSLTAGSTAGMSALPSTTAPTAAEPTFAVYFGQHRSPSESFSHILWDDPWEEIYGSFVTVTTNPNGD